MYYFLVEFLQVRDLDFSVEVIGCDVMRDDDGLAMSSRNVHLSPEEREKVLFMPLFFLTSNFHEVLFLVMHIDIFSLFLENDFSYFLNKK